MALRADCSLPICATLTFLTDEAVRVTAMPVAAFDFEEGNHRLQLLALTGEFLSGTRHLLGGRSILLDDLVELLDGGADLLGAGILLFAGSGDLLHQFGGALDIRHQVAEHVPAFSATATLLAESLLISPAAI